MSLIRHVVVLGDHRSGKTTLVAALAGWPHVGCSSDRHLCQPELHKASCVGQPWSGGTLATVDADAEMGTTVDCRFKETSLVCHSADDSEKRRIVLIDTPGLARYAPNVISGIGIADAAIIVVSAVPEELDETFGPNGQLSNHILYAIGFGITRFLVAVSKMDHPTVKLSMDRFHEVRETLLHYLSDTPAASFVQAQHVVPVSAVCTTAINPLLDQLNELKSYGCDAVSPRKGDYDDESFIAIACRPSGTPRDPCGVMKPVRGSLAISAGETCEASLRGRRYSCYRAGRREMIFPEFHTTIHGQRSGHTIIRCTGDAVECRGSVVPGGNPLRGVVLTSPTMVVPCIRTFRVKMKILNLPCRSLRVGFQGTIDAHTAHYACRVIAVVKISAKGEDANVMTSPMATTTMDHVVENDDVVIDFEHYACSKFVILYPFDELPALGRVLFRAHNCLIGFGAVLSVQRQPLIATSAR